MTRTVEQAGVRNLPVVGEYEVVVAGGGPAGICAGLAAARRGRHVLLVEQFGCLGGMATAGLHQKIAVFVGGGGTPDIVGGIPREIAGRADKDREADFRPEGLFVEMEGLKLLLDEMAEEAGLNLLYYTQVGEPLLDGDRITGIVVHNKSGAQAVLGQRVLDCTGDADVAFRAGCRVMHGRPEDGNMQPATLMYRVGGVDRAQVLEYQQQDRQLKEFCRKAVQKGLMRPWQSELMGFWWIPSRPDQYNINFTHMHVDGTSAADLTRACIEGRKQVQEVVRAMRALIPGFENSYLIDTAASIGIRETRRIYGEYVLTAEDIMSQTVFEDSIGLGAAFIDIHNVEGPGMDRRSGYHQPPGGYYSIPYRTLVPEKFEHLLVAGRCHSATHEAAGSTRWMTQAMVMGQAAGTAAALSIEHGVTPRAIDIPRLQETLTQDGAMLR